MPYSRLPLQFPGRGSEGKEVTLPRFMRLALATLTVTVIGLGLAATPANAEAPRSPDRQRSTPPSNAQENNCSTIPPPATKGAKKSKSSSRGKRGSKGIDRPPRCCAWSPKRGDLARTCCARAGKHGNRARCCAWSPRQADRAHQRPGRACKPADRADRAEQRDKKRAGSTAPGFVASSGQPTTPVPAPESTGQPVEPVAVLIPAATSAVPAIGGNSSTATAARSGGTRAGARRTVATVIRPKTATRQQVVVALPPVSTRDSRIPGAILAVTPQTSFPLFMLVLLVGFLFGQRWIDRGDPKLAKAALARDRDLRFK